MLPERLRPADHAGVAFDHPLMNRREHAHGLVAEDLTDASLPWHRPGEGRALSVDLEPSQERGQSIAEPLVDGALRSPQSRQGLAGFAHVVELAAHQHGEESSAPVRG